MQQRVAAVLAAIRGDAAVSGIAASGPAAADPAVLLADLFSRARERARLLGEFADPAHAPGRPASATPTDYSLPKSQRLPKPSSRPADPLCPSCGWGPFLRSRTPRHAKNCRRPRPLTKTAIMVAGL
jgi:uncharacterized protein DUF2514